MNDEKEKAISLAISTIEKQFGKSALIRPGKGEVLPGIDKISTGCISLDYALGGGCPRGRIIEIYGQESSGKTTWALHLIAEAQKEGGVSAFVDAEHALDLNYAKALGVNTDDLLVSQPDYGEQGLQIVDTLVRSKAVDVIVVDSVAALTPKAELEGEMGNAHVGIQARMMSQACRKLAGIVGNTNCIIVFINQIRMKIGVMYGDPRVTAGGNALKFYASQRLEVSAQKSKKTDEHGNMTHNITTVKVVKNKVAPPFRVAQFEILFGKGIDKWADLVEFATKHNIIQRSGAWYSYKDVMKAQGSAAAAEFLKDNEDVAEEIKQLCMDI